MTIPAGGITITVQGTAVTLQAGTFAVSTIDNKLYKVLYNENTNSVTYTPLNDSGKLFFDFYTDGYSDPYEYIEIGKVTNGKISFTLPAAPPASAEASQFLMTLENYSQTGAEAGHPEINGVFKSKTYTNINNNLSITGGDVKIILPHMEFIYNGTEDRIWQFSCNVHGANFDTIDTYFGGITMQIKTRQ